MNTRASVSSRTSWRYAIGFAFAALLCAVLLGGLSAWFLGSVAIAGLSATAFTFNFHVPGALVRLFAVGRTAARYGERLLGHKAALSDQVMHRVRLFSAMAAAPAVRKAGWQLGDQARLTDYLDDVEDLDYARLRADLPALTLAAGTVVALAATALIAPLALAPIAVILIAILLAGARMAKAGAMAWENARSMRRNGARRLGAAMASAVPLQAEGAWQAQCGEALQAFSLAERRMLDLRRLQSGFDALTSVPGPAAALSVFGAAWLAGARSEALLVPVFLAFAWIALGESTNGASRLLVAALRRRTALAEIGRWIDAGSVAEPGAPSATRPAMLSHSALQRRAPDGRAIGAPIALRLKAGHPTILVGESGSGKTSLLKQIAGWIGDDVMIGDAGMLSPAARRAATMFCPHDAAILADTVRANLFAPGRADAELWDALAAMELDGRIRQAGGLDGWIGQEALSLGEAQRLNLARAWLSDRPVVALDEPTEHLGDEQGRRILQRLLHHLRDRIVVLSSHRVGALPDATTMEL